MKWTLLAFYLLSSFAYAQKAEDCDDDTTKEIKPMMAVVAAVASETQSCPNPKKLENICLNLDNRTRDPRPQGEYGYLHHRKIFEAACVDLAKDSEETIARKIQVMWTSSDDYLKCDSIQFDVPDGNILKFAVAKKFTEFLEDAVYWRVNLNRVDQLDQKTVLDYVQAQIEKNKGLSIESTLRHYYKILRDSGAKHKSEL